MQLTRFGFYCTVKRVNQCKKSLVTFRALWANNWITFESKHCVDSGVGGLKSGRSWNLFAKQHRLLRHKTTAFCCEYAEKSGCDVTISKLHGERGQCGVSLSQSASEQNVRLHNNQSTLHGGKYHREFPKGGSFQARTASSGGIANNSATNMISGGLGTPWFETIVSRHLN